MAWPTDHLTEAATHWETAAERSYTVAHQVWRDAVSVDWRGQAAEVLRTVTHADMQTTSAAADQLQRAAWVARSGASDLYAARSRVRYAVQDARAAGFEVSEDLSVADCVTGGSTAQRAARQAQAHALAGDIRQRATQLVALDQQVAGKITSAVAGIGDAFPQKPPFGCAPPEDNHVHAVDNHWKQDPTPPYPPWDTPDGTPLPPPGPRVEGLPPEGVNPPVDGPLTEGPASRPSRAAKGGRSLYDQHGGEWRYYPGNDFKGQYPHWDYKPRPGPGSKWDNIPIGDLPTHKPPQPPVEPPVPKPPVEPPALKPAPVEPPSLRPEPLPGGGGLGGGGGGGIPGLGIGGMHTPTEEME